MRNPIRQMFPRQENGHIVHKTWDLDLATALAIGGKGRLTADRLESEAGEMAEHFPRWLLTLSRGRDLMTCKHCQGMLVFADGLRCVVCDQLVPRKQASAESNLAWFGLLPPIGVDGLSKIKDRLLNKPPRGHVVGQREDVGSFLLAPLVAVYTNDYPASAPSVFYRPGFFSIPGMPPDTTSHDYHLFGNGQMCLFAAGQWRTEMTIREVLQQRAYAHVIKLLNYANGKKNAFKIVS
jgi:hypothetical protein